MEFLIMITLSKLDIPVFRFLECEFIHWSEARTLPSSLNTFSVSLINDNSCSPRVVETVLPESLGSLDISILSDLYSKVALNCQTPFALWEALILNLGSELSNNLYFLLLMRAFTVNSFSKITIHAQHLEAFRVTINS